MAREEALEVEGTVTQALANTRFRVQLDTGTLVMAHVAGKMRKNFIRIVPGDKVRVNSRLMIWQRDESSTANGNDSLFAPRLTRRVPRFISAAALHFPCAPNFGRSQ